jgi:8-oxo-dGTP diphosphatase
MALIYLQKGFAAFLILVLLFNMSQRKHLEKGERKRYASLLFAVVIFTGFVGVITIRRFALPAATLAAVAGIMALLFVLLRARIFIFRLSCPSCGASFSLKQILYVDDPPCLACSARVSKAAAAADGSLEAAGRLTVAGTPAAALSSAEPPSHETIRVTASTKVTDIDWTTWKYTEEAVLCYIVTGGQVLLMHKKTGLGTGKVNAPGGRIEKGETPEQAAVRETIEEVGLTPYNLEKRMDLHFLFTNGYSLRGYVFFADSCTGTMVETREADPFWCSVDAIPFDRMWADDSVWLARAMAGENLEGFFIFDDDTMLDALVKPAPGEPGAANGDGRDAPADTDSGESAGTERQTDSPAGKNR